MQSYEPACFSLMRFFLLQQYTRTKPYIYARFMPLHHDLHTGSESRVLLYLVHKFVGLRTYLLVHNDTRITMASTLYCYMSYLYE